MNAAGCGSKMQLTLLRAPEEEEKEFFFCNVLFLRFGWERGGENCALLYYTSAVFTKSELQKKRFGVPPMLPPTNTNRVSCFSFASSAADGTANNVP